MIKKILAGLIVAGAFTLFASSASAAVLENAYVSLSSSVQTTQATTYTVNFTHVGSTVRSMDFRFCEEASGGTCTLAIGNGGGDDPTLGTLSGPGADTDANWGTETWDTDTLNIVRDSDNASSAGAWSVEIDNVDNVAVTACTPSSNSSTTTCYLRVNTYQNTSGSTAADSAVLSYTITRAVTISATVDPSFSMIISGINPSTTTTANGTPLDDDLVTTTVTTIPFANLQPGNPKFAAQKIVVTTNVPGGYSVVADMIANMTGTAYNDAISPFAAAGATANTSSAAWTSPTGTVSGTNTGWLGIGTNDTHVTGRGNNQFFPLGTTDQTVANQSSSAQSEENLVTFGIEVNAYQQADSYTGTLRYNALPVY